MNYRLELTYVVTKILTLKLVILYGSSIFFNHEINMK